jgi:hypothetical protein
MSAAVSTADRLAFGEVTTPPSLVTMALDALPPSAYSPGSKWLDAGAGQGCFARGVHRRLVDHGGVAPQDAWQQIGLSELNPDRILDLAPLVERGAALHAGDFLSLGGEGTYDAVVGNPPYVVSGRKKVPTLGEVSKRDDGKTAWPSFVRRALWLLKPGGHLAFVIPALWLRPDRAGIHDLLLSREVLFCRSFGCGETSKLFKGEAQTPTCVVVLANRPRTAASVPVYCNALEHQVQYPLPALRESVPLYAASILAKLRSLVLEHGGLQARKTNMPRASTITSAGGAYAGVRTCVLDGLQPRLVLERADVPFPWQGLPKLILAHKMYGFPYHDSGGELGVSRRDNYVLLERENGDLGWIKELLETRLARCVFVACRYRMRYLERQAFEFLPDPSKVPGFPRPATDAALAEFLGLSEEQAACVYGATSKDYSTF